MELRDRCMASCIDEDEPADTCCIVDTKGTKEKSYKRHGGPLPILERASNGGSSCACRAPHTPSAAIIGNRARSGCDAWHALPYFPCFPSE